MCVQFRANRCIVARSFVAGDTKRMHDYLAQFLAQGGEPVLWYQLAQAVEGTLRARLMELDADSARWPCDPSAAAGVVLKAVAGAGSGGGSGTLNVKGVAYRAYVRPNELQDLVDVLSRITDLQAQRRLKIRFSQAVEATTDGELEPEASTDLQKALDDISDASH